MTNTYDYQIFNEDLLEEANISKSLVKSLMDDLQKLVALAKDEKWDQVASNIEKILEKGEEDETEKASTFTLLKRALSAIEDEKFDDAMEALEDAIDAAVENYGYPKPKKMTYPGHRYDYTYPEEYGYAYSYSYSDDEYGYDNPMDMPFHGATSLGEIEEHKEAVAKEREFAQLWHHFVTAMDNIRNRNDVKDKADALAQLVTEFKDRLADIKSISPEELILALQLHAADLEYEEIKSAAGKLFEATTVANELAKIGRRHRAGDMDRVQKIHDYAGELGAACKMGNVPDDEMKEFLERAQTPPELRKSENGHDDDAEAEQLFSFKHLIRADPVPE